MVTKTGGMETETADDSIALSDRLVPPLDKNQRAFRLALIIAFLIHASVFIEIGRSVPRTIGDRSGASDAISVDLVTEADLRSRETVSLPAAGVPTPPPSAVPQPEAPQPEPQPQQPEPQQEAAETAPKEPPPVETTEPKPEQKATLPDFETALQDLATTPLPSEQAKQEPQQPQETKNAPQEPAKPVEKKEPSPPAKKKVQEQARLDPTPTPRDLMNAPPGRSAAISRPPGITRSGENDEFGRAVIRALRQTMPPPRGIFGRVTVRLILSMNGDLERVEMLGPSGTSLDQSVVFATKQTYFPLPPYNATSADRTFVITYVYR